MLLRRHCQIMRIFRDMLDEMLDVFDQGDSCALGNDSHVLS